jgi:hypothetical protein
MGGTVAAGAAGAAAGATSTVTPAPASRTLHSSAPTLTFIHSSLCSPLALTFIHPSIHPSLSSPLVLTPTLTLICQALLSIVWVPLFTCLCAPMLCGGSLIVPVYKSKISYHNTLFALTFG